MEWKISDSHSAGPGRGWRRRGLWLAGGALGLLAGAVVLGSSLLPEAAEAHRRFGHGSGHGLLGRDGPHEFDEERLRMVAEWVLGRVDASDEQIDAVVVIAGRTVDEIAGFKQAHRERRAAFVRALSGEAVDRAALQALRAEELGAVDEVSERLVIALAEVAEVLNPEQRVELLELHQRFHRH